MNLCWSRAVKLDVCWQICYIWIHAIIIRAGLLPNQIHKLYIRATENHAFKLSKSPSRKHQDKYYEPLLIILVHFVVSSFPSFLTCLPSSIVSFLSFLLSSYPPSSTHFHLMPLFPIFQLSPQVFGSHFLFSPSPARSCVCGLPADAADPVSVDVGRCWLLSKLCRIYHQETCALVTQTSSHLSRQSGETLWHIRAGYCKFLSHLATFQKKK